VLNKNIHANLYLFGLCVIAFSLPLLEYLANAAQIFLITNWILELDFKNKLQKLKDNKSIIIFILLFIVPLIWLLNSNNIDFGLIDLKIRLPILALPVIIGTSKTLSGNKLNLILLLFITGVFISSFAGFLGYHNIWFNVDTDNIRNVSMFVSHIRLSLMISLSVFIILYWIYNKIINKKILVFSAITLIVWFIYFLMFMQGFTGIITIVVVGFIILLKLSFSKISKRHNIFYLSLILVFFILIVTYLGILIKEFYTPTQPKEINERTHTIKGNLYWNDKNSQMIENGNLVYRNISKEELDEEWYKRSSFDINGYDKRGQDIFHTLVRYLTSKGLTKDAEGLAKLSDQDIRNIEDGNSNYKYTNNKGLKQRIYTTIWQIDVYSKGGNPSGHSITQRVEYQKVGLELLKRNLLFGTGTGDLDDDYKALYDELNSPLEINCRHRAHNQFFTFFISFGIIGGIICLFAWIHPLIMEWNNRNYFFLVFFLIATISMFSDDTLETTTGVVFCSYFYSLLLWGKKQI
jgi:hypothetical protein